MDASGSQRSVGRSKRRPAGAHSFLIMSKLMDLSGRVAVVIGATSGLGRAIARGLAEHGAHVVPTGRRRAEVEQICAEVHAGVVTTTDVTNLASLEELRDEVISRHRRVDILVNAAGYTLKKPTVEITEPEWTALFDTNLNGALRTCQVFHEL